LHGNAVDRAQVGLKVDDLEPANDQPLGIWPGDHPISPKKVRNSSISLFVSGTLNLPREAGSKPKQLENALIAVQAERWAASAGCGLVPPLRRLRMMRPSVSRVRVAQASSAQAVQ
jgi:hypothetical protein